MRTIDPPDSHYVSSAIGWVGLGNSTEARAELAEVSKKYHKHPLFLEAQWMIAAHEERWEEALRAATNLTVAAPEESSGWLHRSYALRRIPGGSVQQAKEALLPALNKFPLEPIVPYNLSCYACLLEDLDSARKWFKRAIAIAGKEAMKAMALHDADLEPLWEEIRQM